MRRHRGQAVKYGGAKGGQRISRREKGALFTLCKWRRIHFPASALRGRRCDHLAKAAETSSALSIRLSSDLVLARPIPILLSIF